MEMDFTVDKVLEVLRAAACQDVHQLNQVEQLHTATRMLTNWSRMPSFNSVLSRIWSSDNIEISVRCLAIIQSRNSCRVHWRSCGDDENSVIRINEKQAIRDNILYIIQNTKLPSTLTTHIADLVGVIVRNEAYNCWPNLVPSLLGLMDRVFIQIYSGETCSDINRNSLFEEINSRGPAQAQFNMTDDLFIAKMQALTTLYQVAKSMRMNSKMSVNFREFTNQVVKTVYAHTNFDLIKVHPQTDNTCTPPLQPHNVKAMNEITRMQLKILKKLAEGGFKDEDNESPNESSDLCSPSNMMLHLCKLSLTLINEMAEFEREYMDDKLLKIALKILTETLYHCPKTFLRLMSESLSCIVKLLFNNQYLDKFDEKFRILGLNFICKILRHKKYDESSKLFPADAKQYYASVKVLFFTNSTVEQMCRCLLDKYVCLNQDDVDMWTNDPETYVQRSLDDNIEVSLQASADKLLLTLNKHFSEVVNSLLKNLLTSITDLSCTSMETAIYIDAVFHAIGVCAFEIYDDISSWCVNVLLKQISYESNSLMTHIVHRRLLWLVSRWTFVELPSAHRNTVYTLVNNSLRSEAGDFVVRMEALNLLKICINDIDLDCDLLQVHLNQIGTNVFKLLADIEDLDNQTTILDCVSDIFSRMSKCAEELVEPVLIYLPKLWNHTESNSIVNNLILQVICQIIECLGPECSRLQEFVVEILRKTTSDHQSCAFEDGLVLWRCLLQHLPCHSDLLLAQYQLVLPFFEYGYEHYKLYTDITIRQILLSKMIFIQTYSNEIVRLVTESFSDTPACHLCRLMNVLDYMLVIKIDNQDCLLYEDLLVRKVVNHLVKEPINIAVFTSLWNVLSRFILYSYEFFDNIITSYCNVNNKRPDIVKQSLVEQWLDNIDNIESLLTKKLYVITMMELFKRPEFYTSSLLPSFIYNVVETIHVVCPNGKDVFLIEDVDDNPVDHEARLRQLYTVNPSYVVDLLIHAKEVLSNLESSYGAQKFKNVINDIDPDVWQQLNQQFTELPRIAGNN